MTVRTATRSLFALALAAGLAMASYPAAGKCKLVRLDEWPVRLVGNRILADGAINGEKVAILLDTGAQRSLVLRSAAVRLNLPRHEARGHRFFGIGGEAKVEIATVDELRIGENTTRGLQFFAAGEQDLGADIAVILGEDFFQRVDVEFDLAHHAVRLHQPIDCSSASLSYWTTEIAGEVDIEPIDEARPRIDLTVRINDKPIRAILDSGAFSSALTTDDAAALGVTPETAGVVASSAFRGLGAKPVDSWIGPFESFVIGNVTIADVRIRFADLYRDATFATTGSRLARKAVALQPMLLGADFLRAHRVYVAHSQRKLFFTYTGGPVFHTD